MYTIDDQYNSEYEEEKFENNFWDNHKGLIIKIIIIILCIIVLIWLFKALKTKRNTNDDASIHAANVLKVRLAAEDYFFLQNNKNDTGESRVSLLTLKNNNLVDDIKDANNKVCSDESTNVTLLKETGNYKMTVKLSCSTNDKEETFYYHGNTLACLNCNGQSKMNGNDNEKNNEEENEGDKNDSDVVPVDNNDYDEYSCIHWSDWTKNRVNNEYLEERSKTLVQGVKYGGTISKTIYGDWSQYTTTPIKEQDNLEVETKVVREDVWSSIKTARNINKTNNIRIISEEVVNENNSCKNGFVVDNKCYSNQVKVGNLTFKEYHSGNYIIKNNLCETVKTLQNKEGKYVLTYVNCQYNEIINTNNSSNDSYTIYKYQELVSSDVTYYRSRSVSVINEQTETIYTKDKYEENSLPEGFVKVAGSEEVYYSYKLPVCEK